MKHGRLGTGLTEGECSLIKAAAQLQLSATCGEFCRVSPPPEPPEKDGGFSGMFSMDTKLHFTLHSSVMHKT